MPDMIYSYLNVFPKLMVRRLLILTGVLTFSLFLASGCSTTESSAEGNRVDSLSNATAVDTASGEKKLSPEEEIKKITEQLKFSPKNYELYHQRSLLYYELGNTVQAVQDMEKSKELNVTFAETYHMLGFYAYVQNDEERAMKNLKNAQQMGSENPETYYLMGQINFFRKNYGEARKFYESAISMDSLQPVYPFAIGFMAQQEGKIDEAVKWYEKTLEVYPGFIKALSQLHDIYRNIKNDNPSALAYNDRILLVDSMHPVGRFNQGLYFMDRASRVTDEDKAMEYDVLLKLAISEFGKAILRDEAFVNAYYNRGYCYFMLGQFNQALQDFSTVIELNPFYYQAFFYQGAIYEQYKDTASAINAYEQALKINPGLRDAKIAIKELSVR